MLTIIFLVVINGLHQVGLSHCALARMDHLFSGRGADSNGSKSVDSERKQYAKAINECFKDALMEIRLPMSAEPFFWSWWILNPAKLMQLFVRHNSYYKDLTSQAASENAPNPSNNAWRLIIYSDEICCGNVLKADNKRKATAFYFASHEHGLSLRSENARLCPAVIPHDKIKLVDGGLSCVLKHLLKDAFFAEGESLLNGVHLAAEVPTMAFATLSNILGDEASLKGMFASKGASGTKPCLLCKNVVAKGSLQQHDSSGYLVSISACSLELCDQASDEEIWAIADNLAHAAGVCTKTELRKLEKATGLNRSENELLRT